MSYLEAMYKRVSTRKYKEESIGYKLNRIKRLIEQPKVLDKKIGMDIHLIKQGGDVQEVIKGVVGNYGKIKAPHYLIATSEERDGYLENVGFALEHIVIELTAMGLGTCWIGSGIKGDEVKKIITMKPKHQPVIVVAFGLPQEEINLPVKRKRLEIGDFTEGDFDEHWYKIMEAVRVAPSAVNSQPWRFFKNDDVIDMYISSKKYSLAKVFLADTNRIDAGIALAHVSMAADYYGLHIEMMRGPSMDRKNHQYITSIIEKEPIGGEMV